MWGPGISAFDMAEQFTFQQGFGQGAAIDGDQGFLRPVMVIMNGAGDQFLAGCRFPPE